MPLYKYFKMGQFTSNYILYQYKFTYQNCGYIKRGLFPSFLELLNLNNQYTYFVIFNLILIIYTFIVVQIANKYLQENINSYILSFLFLFFGVPHFTLDIYRIDILIQLITLFILLLLKNEKYLVAFLLSLLSILIHEASLFLIIPIFFLIINDRKKWYFSFYLTIFFLMSLLLSHKLSQNEAIIILKENNSASIEYSQYAAFTLGFKDTILMYFRMYNVGFFIIYGFCYFIILYLSFKKLFTGKFTDYKWLFLFPLLLCFVAVDFLRWYCFVYFLAMLYALYYNVFSRKSFYYILFISIILGIPLAIDNKFGIIHIVFYLLK